MASGHWNIPFLMTYCPYILDLYIQIDVCIGSGCVQMLKTFAFLAISILVSLAQVKSS